MRCRRVTEKLLAIVLVMVVLQVDEPSSSTLFFAEAQNLPELPGSGDFFLQPWRFFRYDVKNSGEFPFRIPSEGLNGETSPSVFWKYHASDFPIQSSACIDSERRLFFGSDDANIYGLDVITGEELWRHSTDGPVQSSCQTERGWDGIETVYIGDNAGKIYAILAESGEDKFPPYQTRGPVKASPIVRDHLALNGTTLYVGSDDGVIHGWDVRNNVQRYELDIYNETTALSASYAKCSLVIAFKDGTVRSINPHHFPGYSPTPGDECCHDVPPVKSTFDAGAPILAEPMTFSRDSESGSTPVQDIVITTVDGHLFSIDAVTGEINWEISLDANDGIFASGTSTDSEGRIYIANSGGEVFSIDGNTGRLLWRKLLPDCGIIHSAATDRSGQLFVPTSNGLYALSGADGELVWEFGTSEGLNITNSVALTRTGQIVFGTASGDMYKIGFQRF